MCFLLLSDITKMSTCTVNKIQFKVVGCTSWEDGYHPKNMEDLHPFVKGWRSERYCLFPQQVVLDLKAQIRIRKLQLLSHEYMIASKIELFVGKSFEVQNPLATDKLSNVHYKRLGYVSLSENCGTSYKSREMKTINVDTVAQYLKLVLHTNHLNHLNLYSQVSVLGLNVLGQKDIQDRHLTSTTGKQPPVRVLAIDDLIFDFSLDPQSADCIRKLSAIKQLAINEDNFEFAKILKAVIEEMSEVGKVLCQMEKQKRIFVEQEDYDAAKNMKEKKDKLQLEVYQKLHLTDLLKGHLPSSHIPQNNERAIEKDHQDDYSLPQIPGNTSHHSVATTDERQLPLSSTKYSFSEFPDPETEVLYKPEPLSDAQLNASAIAIQVFGTEIVEMIFSKQYQLREKGLKSVLTALASHSDFSKSEMIKGVCQILNKSLNDKVLTSYGVAICILQELLGSYAKLHRFNESEVSYIIDKLLPVLMNRLADANSRVHSLTLQTILEIATESSYKPLVAQHIISPLVNSKIKVLNDGVESIARTITWRYAKGRLDLLDNFIKTVDLKSTNLTLDKIMEFVNVCLQHTHSKVRDTAAQLTVRLYEEYNGHIRDLLPVNAADHIAMKNVFWRSLFQHFDKIDGVSMEDQDINLKKMKKLQKLKGQLTVLRNLVSEDKGEMTMSQIEEVLYNEQSTDVAVDIDQTCPFCKESKPELKSHMDQHYYVDCPMLLQCKRCSQVVEIKNLASHYVNDCTDQSNMAECSKCHEVFSNVQLESHTKASRCTAPPDNHIKCPLCHANVKNTEESWYLHLTSVSSGCAKNPRRKRRRGQQVLTTKKNTLVTECATVIPR